MDMSPPPRENQAIKLEFKIELAKMSLRTQYNPRRRTAAFGNNRRLSITPSLHHSITPPFHHSTYATN